MSGSSMGSIGITAYGLGPIVTLYGCPPPPREYWPSPPRGWPEPVTNETKIDLSGVAIPDTAGSLLERCKARLREVERLIKERHDLEAEAETLRKMIVATEKADAK